MSALGAGQAATGLSLTHAQALLLYSTSVTQYLALCSAPVNPMRDTGASIAEIAYQGYQRATVHSGPASGAGDWAQPDQYGRIQNANPISFPAIQSAPAGLQAGYWALLDSPVLGQGNVRWSGVVPTLAITPLDPIITLLPGTLTLALA